MAIKNRITEGGAPHCDLTINLPCARLAPELAHNLNRLPPAVGVAFRQMSATCVDRERTAQLDATILRPVGCFARLREPEPLQCPENLRGKAVVAVECIDVLRADACARVNRLVAAGRLIVGTVALVDPEAGLAEYKLVG